MSKASEAAYARGLDKAKALPALAASRLFVAHGDASCIRASGGEVAIVVPEGQRLEILEAAGDGPLMVTARVEAGGVLSWSANRLPGKPSARSMSVEVAARGAFELIESIELGAGDSHVGKLVVVLAGAKASAELECVATQEEGSAFCQEVFGLIKSGASGSSFAQSTRSLRFGKPALTLIEPNLAVEVDEAKATHGAAHGQVGAEAVHALMSKGFERWEAEKMLREAFLRSPWVKRGLAPESAAKLGLSQEDPL